MFWTRSLRPRWAGPDELSMQELYTQDCAPHADRKGDHSGSQGCIFFIFKQYPDSPEGGQKRYIELRHMSVDRQPFNSIMKPPPPFPPPIKTNENFSIEHASRKGETKSLGSIIAFGLSPQAEAREGGKRKRKEKKKAHNDTSNSYCFPAV